MALPDSKTKAFTEMYTDFYPLISNVVFSKLRDRDVTHDICQEVFIRYYMKFEEVDNHRRWLLNAVNYVLLEYYRKTKGDHIDINSIIDDVSMSFVNGFRDTRLMIEEALEEIENFGSEKNRILFNLIAIYNYTYKEAGENLGLSEHQARYWYNIVVDKLMAHFRKKGIHSMEELL
ncbi:MAG TPA: sigma-70 family RNA polymerase sigma factor [Spirochaetota bacterium]